MRGAKPEQSVEAAIEEALSNLRIETPREEVAKNRSVPPSSEPQTTPYAKPAVAQKFEAIMQQELAGTSFTQGLDRRSRAQERLAQRAERRTAPEKGETRPLNGARTVRSNVFTGPTVLDKLVSFLVFLIKSLEKKLLGGGRRFNPFFKKNQQLAQQKQLQALTQKKEQKRRVKDSRGGPVAK